MMNRKLVLACALLLGLPGIGNAEGSTPKVQGETMRARLGEVKTQARFEAMVDEASGVYSAIAKGPHGEVPATVLTNAKCIAVLPNVITGAVTIGGTHGNGLASCKNENNVWSQPAPITLNQGSLGLQIGAKSTDLVLYFRTNEAVQTLRHGDFTIGSDVSAVAGTFDSSMDTAKAGILAYSRTDGLFAGAALSGGKIGRDQSEIATYYGKNIEYTALLEGRVSPDSSGYTQKLTKLFPS